MRLGSLPNPSAHEAFLLVVNLSNLKLNTFWLRRHVPNHATPFLTGLRWRREGRQEADGSLRQGLSFKSFRLGNVGRM